MQRNITLDGDSGQGLATASLLIVLGCARLPKSIGGEQPSTLIIELALDTQDGRIAHVATTMPLPGYNATLRSLLLGRRLDEVEGATQKLSAHLRGPLLKPTLAALANCVSNCEEGTQPIEAHS